MTDIGVPVSQISGIALESVPGVAEADPEGIYRPITVYRSSGIDYW